MNEIRFSRFEIIIISILIIVQNSVVLMLCLLGLIPDGVSKELLFAIVNGTGTAQGFVLSYFFGSSSNSTAKNAVIDKLASKIN